MNKELKKQGVEGIVGILKRNETFSILLIFLFLVAALSSIFISPRFYHGIVNEGDVALKEVFAPYDFTYFWGVDEEGTQKARKEAVEAVPYFLYRDIDSEEKTRSRLGRFFDALKQQKQEEAALDVKIAAVKKEGGTDLSDRDIRSLMDHPDADALRSTTLEILDKIYLLGFIGKNNIEMLKKEQAEKVIIFDRATGVYVERDAQDLLDEDRMKETVREMVTEDLDANRKTKQADEALLTGYISPNLEPDEKTTLDEREEALNKTEPIYKSWTVKKNELIIGKGMRVSARHVAQITQIRSIFRPGKSPVFFFGVLLLFALMGLAAGIFTAFNRKMNFLRNTKEIAIVLINMLLVIVISDFIVQSPQPSYFIPMASVGMLITLLVGFNIGFLSVVIMSILISVLVGGKVELAFVLFIGSVVGMFAVREARRRANILWAGLFVGLAKFLAIVSIGLINNMDIDFFLDDGVWGIASGMLSGFIVMGLLPVFEHFFKVPTNISLLELSDLNHPLLRKLAVEAPGTYHHSIMVGNLAEAACDAIGANSLLARVGAYYHDIGKMTKAEYFSENEMGAGSKHSKLTPQMSALIIGKHVKEGVEMANKYKLNKTIIDFINQHHGTSLIQYFYQKAIEKSPQGEELNEAVYRYPGPRPQTKESAIVLLADSVEASSRSLEEPTPSSIRNLVRKIVNNKFIDGQLDECDLTLKDMHKIAESFVRVLMGFFHTRLSYPEDVKKDNSGQPDENNGKLRKQKPPKKS